MALATRNGRGSEESKSKQKAVVSDDVEVQNKYDPIVVEQVSEEKLDGEVRIHIHDNEEETQNDVNPSREHVIDILGTFVNQCALVEVLEQMPGYAKFMKNLVTKKRSMDCKTIKMTHQVSVIVHSMAPKLEDPVTFTIPCTIGSADFAKDLCDLGASINLSLIPYSKIWVLVNRGLL
ncbi:uncharacterized protein [Nicotiana sylvestris]|uniref:uncharacterized protein n=1 Tax=Nicotiana sylvestris TaxID=4096 RepID=UPI00388C74B0